MNKLLSLLIIGSVASHLYAETLPGPSQKDKEVIREKQNLKKIDYERLLLAFRYIGEKCREDNAPQEVTILPGSKKEFDEMLERHKKAAVAQATCQELRALLSKCLSIHVHSLEHENPTCALALLRFLKTQDNLEFVYFVDETVAQ